MDVPKDLVSRIDDRRAFAPEWFEAISGLRPIAPLGVTCWSFSCTGIDHRE